MSKKGGKDERKEMTNGKREEIIKEKDSAGVNESRREEKEERLRKERHRGI